MKEICKECSYREKNPNVFDLDKYRCGLAFYRYIDGVGSVKYEKNCIHDVGLTDMFTKKKYKKKQ